ncbi:chromophore lyase CpcT/CpeT [uncultured Croceitalea sp.]|uniref:chromophore lyase CpcT/CpeT n=1 Tax=uncultured Croceitalea sp. TaxID=1798908 RepID=UPI0033061635
MKRLIVMPVLLFLFILVGGLKETTTTEQNSIHDLQQDLDTLLTWFPGEYDNHRQVYKEAVAKLPSEKRHRQTHHIFYEVQLDFIPGSTLYAQQSQHYNLDDLYRQRVYAFEIDTTERAIRLRIYTPKEPSRLTNSHLDPEVFSKLNSEDFFLKPGCDVFWKREGDAFKGYLKENACNYYSDRFGKQVYLNETLILRKDALLLEDTATDAEGNPVFGVHDKGPTINLKEKPCK